MVYNMVYNIVFVAQKKNHITMCTFMVSKYM